MGLLAIFTDITQRKRAADDLRKSEQEFRRVWEESLDGMRLTNENGMTVRVNGAFCKMVGMSPEQMEGKPLSIIYQSDQDYILGKHKERFAQRSIEPLFERELSLWHGKRVWFELSNSFIEVDGQPPHLLSIFRDVTERKLQEEVLQDFAARLERSNRELQDFAYVASHDLQEPLRKVAVFGDRLRMKFGEALGPEGCDYIERMQKASSRMKKLITDLLTFSRVTSKSQPFVEVDLNKLVREVISDLETSLEQAGGTVQIEKLPVIEAEPLYMRQLFQNLIGNALKFTQPNVNPVVEIKSRLLKGKGPLGSDQVEISVSDNGIGFDEKYLDRIFQVFQRLHNRSEYQGTGMGLAITRKIVEHHRGRITARSKPGKGATFIVTLPVEQSKTMNPA
jgi:two-component system, LuxR family, sensor kinase FixL